MFGRRKIAMALAEFLGTGILTLVVLSVARSSVGIPYFVALAAGLAVAVLMLVLGSISGAQLNPALTFGLWTGRRVKTVAMFVYIAMQFAGAAVAFLLYTYLVNAHWTNSGHFSARIMVAEAVGAFIFTFAWAAAARMNYEGGRMAAAAGIAVAAGMIVASSASNGFINPALALGARSWVWGTYVAGPVIGAVIGVNLYDLVFGESRLARAVATVGGRNKAANNHKVVKNKKK